MKLDFDEAALFAVNQGLADPDVDSPTEAVFTLLVQVAGIYTEALMNGQPRLADADVQRSYEIEMEGVLQSLRENLELLEAKVEMRYLDVVIS